MHLKYRSAANSVASPPQLSNYVFRADFMQNHAYERCDRKSRHFVPAVIEIGRRKLLQAGFDGF